MAEAKAEARVEEWVVAEARAEEEAWAQAQAEPWDAEAVSRRAPEDTACVRIAEKGLFTRRERPAIIRFVRNAAQP